MPHTVEVEARLLPPLSNTSGRERVRLTLEAPATLQKVIDALLERFDSQEFRLHLYDTQGRLIPAWCAFINGKPSPLGRGEGTRTPVHDGDEVSFLLNLAGG